MIPVNKSNTGDYECVFRWKIDSVVVVTVVAFCIRAGNCPQARRLAPIARVSLGRASHVLPVLVQGKLVLAVLAPVDVKLAVLKPPVRVCWELTRQKERARITHAGRRGS